MSLLDLILRCDESSLIHFLWTEDLLPELNRKWVERFWPGRPLSTPSTRCSSDMCAVNPTAADRPVVDDKIAANAS